MVCRKFEYHQIHRLIFNRWQAWIRATNGVGLISRTRASKMDIPVSRSHDSSSFFAIEIYRKNSKRANGNGQIPFSPNIPAFTVRVDEQMVFSTLSESLCAMRVSVFSSLFGKFVVLTRQKNANNNNCFFSSLVYFFFLCFYVPFVFQSRSVCSLDD